MHIYTHKKKKKKRIEQAILLQECTIIMHINIYNTPHFTHWHLNRLAVGLAQQQHCLGMYTKMHMNR